MAALIGTRQFADAHELLERIGPLQAAADPFWRLRQLQLLCAFGELARAEQTVEAWGGFPQLPPEASPVGAGILASQGRWMDLVAFLDDRVARRMPVRGDLFLEAVAAAARHTGRYGEVISLLDSAMPSRKIVRLREALVSETQWRARLVPSEVAAQIPSDPDGLRPLRDPFQVDRLAAIEAAIRPRDQSGPPSPVATSSSLVAHDRRSRLVLWCTDRQYLLGTCVSVWSLLRHNPPPAGRLGLVAAPDAVDLAAEATGQLSRASGIPITLVDASDVVPAGPPLKARYGIFSPGHSLSDAAYYRLFAIRALTSSGLDRIVYLDSDTCIGPGIDSFFHFDLRGRPLAARYERPSGLRFESRRAIICSAAERLGVDEAAYFNSGVLVFDGRHPDLIEGLERAIEASLYEQQRLTFHDQCALNLAFAGRVTALDERFNLFVRPQQASTSASSVVLHYLERPKPWDPLYPTANCRRWHGELASFADVVPSPLLARLFTEALWP